MRPCGSAVTGSLGPVSERGRPRIIGAPAALAGLVVLLAVVAVFPGGRAEPPPATGLPTTIATTPAPAGDLHSARPRRQPVDFVAPGPTRRVEIPAAGERGRWRDLAEIVSTLVAALALAISATSSPAPRVALAILRRPLTHSAPGRAPPVGD